ncbi:hypothetical protein D3C87_175690 [compost metagenome]
MGNRAFKQELFLIDESHRKKVVRQDRTDMAPGTCFLDFKEFQAQVVNISPFGCAILVSIDHYEAVKRHAYLNPGFEVDLIFNQVRTQTLSLRWVHSQSDATSVTGEMVIGFEVVGEPLQTERIKALESSAEVIEKQIKYTAETQRIPAPFKTFVYELKDWLEKLKANIDLLEKDTPVDSWREAQDYKMTIADAVSDFLNKVIPLKYKELPVLTKDISKDDLEVATAFAREHLGQLVYGAPFASRAYYKPRGYAGDYEMMNHLYRDEMVGKSFYDQCMHKYFVDEPAGAAVKNRGHYLFEKITDLFKKTSAKQPLKVLSIASGPAMEQQLFLQNSKEFYGRTAEFTCLDQDEESLKHAQKQLYSMNRFVKSGFTFKFNNMAIRNVIGRGCPDTDYDLIYSAGLFDYFTEPVARMTAKKMLAAVKTGGQVIIGNFSKDNPSAPFMELILDWHLIYRSEEDLLRIFQGLGSKMWVEKEPLGINLFIVIQK